MTCRIGKLLEVFVGPARLLFFFLLLMNIGIRADPHPDIAVRVPHGVSAAEVPTVLSVRATKALLEVEGLATVHGFFPLADIPVDVLRMNEPGPSPTL